MVFLKKLKARAREGRGDVRKLVQINYTSRPVSIPTDFLSSPPPSTHPPVTYRKIDFTTSPIPEYQAYYAVVLDNVLSPSECQELIHLAELSAGANNSTNDNLAPQSEEREREKREKDEKVFDVWKPALLNAGAGLEFSAKDYRNSDRIIWDSDEIADRIWSRCLLAPQLSQDLQFIEGQEKESILGRRAVSAGLRWKITRLNGRLRFLRYGAGQFFRPHCDGFYETPDHKERTFYTLHLYLNDSVQAKRNSIASEAEGPSSSTSSSSFQTCTGGATTFHSPDHERRLDVDPVAGRVLIFQHAGLRHSGDDVTEGTKYTVRADILYTPHRN